MNFKEWLISENNRKITFTSMGTDGNISVIIGNKKYHYEMKPYAPIKNWLELYSLKPGVVLNQIKQQIKAGNGILARIEQLQQTIPIVEPIPDLKRISYTQKSLFDNSSTKYPVE